MQITDYQTRLDGARWIDINSSYTLDNLPDRLPDQLAIINSSLYNLLNCVPGQRGRIFQPEYGSQWMQFIHEPILDITAKKMEILMIQSIIRWVPQITLNQADTRIDADLSLPGYKVRIPFSTPFSYDEQQIKFSVNL